jgi:flagellar biosynthesis protein FliP
MMLVFILVIASYFACTIGTLRSESSREISGTVGAKVVHRSAAVKTPKETMSENSQNFELEVLPLTLMAAIVLLSVIVIVMSSFLIARLRTRRRKRITFLER